MVPAWSDRAALRGTQPQSGGVKGEHDLATRHDKRPLLDRDRTRLVGDVVVIALERAAWYADPLGEGVQLGEGVIAYEVTPHAAAPVPVGFVEEQGHMPRLAFRGVRRADPAQCREVGAHADVDPEQQCEDQHDARGHCGIDEGADVGVEQEEVGHDDDH